MYTYPKDWNVGFGNPKNSQRLPAKRDPNKSTLRYTLSMKTIDKLLNTVRSNIYTEEQP